MIDLDLLCQIQLKISISLCPFALSELIHLPLEKRHNSHDYLECFTVLTVSQSPSSAHAYRPSLLCDPDCFIISALGIFADLGSWGYFGVLAILLCIMHPFIKCLMSQDQHCNMSLHWSTQAYNIIICIAVILLQTCITAVILQHGVALTHYMLIFHGKLRNVSTIYIIPPHWHGTFGWNPST